MYVANILTYLLQWGIKPWTELKAVQTSHFNAKRKRKCSVRVELTSNPWAVALPGTWPVSEGPTSGHSFEGRHTVWRKRKLDLMPSSFPDKCVTSSGALSELQWVKMGLRVTSKRSCLDEVLEYGSSCLFLLITVLLRWPTSQCLWFYVHGIILVKF